MKNKIVWVFGSSAAGKKRFVLKGAIKFTKHKLRSLNWQNRKIVYIKKSINYLKHYNKNNSKQNRDDIIKDVLKISKNNNKLVVLIKDQTIDLKEKRLQKLKKFFLLTNTKLYFSIQI